MEFTSSLKSDHAAHRWVGKAVVPRFHVTCKAVTERRVIGKV